MQTTIKRKNPIYGNCSVYSPDNTLMFRCVEKRAKWYLDRNLAVVISNDPLSVKLNFKPKGLGERLDSLKAERKNMCVVCGSEDVAELTRHHVIPLEYRKFFPSEKKGRCSRLVVPICISCHTQYEDVAKDLKKQLEVQYQAPRNHRKFSTHLSYLTAILKYGEKIPLERLEKMKETEFLFLFEQGLLESIRDLDSQEKIADIIHILELSFENEKTNHSKTVVDKTASLDEFERLWVNHFLNTMKPKYAPEYLKIS